MSLCRAVWQRGSPEALPLYRNQEADRTFREEHTGKEEEVLVSDTGKKIVPLTEI